MTRNGKVATGCFNVRVEGKEAARKRDLTDHGGLIVTGCTTVQIGGPTLLAARLGDQFTCPAADASAHVGGVIMPPCCTTVRIGGRSAARLGDPTFCAQPAAPVAAAGTGGGGGGSVTECAELWAKYAKEAEDLLAPGDHDHLQRNQIISGAYADLYLRNPEFKWAGLAGYASKQVGCVLSHMREIMALDDHVPRPGADPASAALQMAVRGAALDAAFAEELIGQGNRALFLDTYPVHRFYQEQGWAKLEVCASARVPPLTGPAVDAFKALHLARKTQDRSYLRQSLDSLVAHEQIDTLQRLVYSNQRLQALLDFNEKRDWLPYAMPAHVVMGTGCSDPTGGKQTHKFRRGSRDQLYSVPERMDWILGDIANDYFGFEGSPRHLNDLNEIRSRGDKAGGKYP